MHNKKQDHTPLAIKTGGLLDQGYHWSEAIMLSVGEYMLENMDDQMCRMATGFSGGGGRTERDLCGALTAGIMVIGALHGRISPQEDEDQCMLAVNQFRDRFAQTLGSVHCYELREEKYGSHNQEPCSVLVTRAADILLEILDG